MVMADEGQAVQIVASVAAKDLAPGLTATLTGTIPDASTAKASHQGQLVSTGCCAAFLPLCAQVGIDYILPHLTVNGSFSLTSSPVIEVAATTGRSDFFAGGQATFNSSRNEVTAWTAGAGGPVQNHVAAVGLTAPRLTVSLKAVLDSDVCCWAQASHERTSRSACPCWTRAKS